MTANQEIDTVLVIDAQPRGPRDYRDALVRELGARQKVVEVGSMEAALALTGNLLSCVLIDPQVSDFQPEKLDSLAKKDADPWVPVVLVLSHATPKGRFDELETEVFDVVIRGEREEGDACRAVRNGIELVELRRLVGRDLKGSDRQASSDVIAELQPRDLLRARLTEALSRAGDGNHTGVILIGLDDFKAVNTSFGHGAGDAMLAELERRLRHSIRNVDTIVRWSFEEFALLLQELSRPDDASFVVQRIQYALSRSFLYEGHELYLTASIGTAVHPEGGVDGRTLLQHADAALYRVRKAGGNGSELFSLDNEAGAQDRIELVTRLRNALKRDEFVAALSAYFGRVRGERGGSGSASALERFRNRF